MSLSASAPATMMALRFHAYGEPAEVLRLEAGAVPEPGPGRIRVRVAACGLNPADWALCKGLFASELPRGVGLDVSGVVDAVGEGVTDIGVGDPALGSADFASYPSAGVADYAILSHWTRVPAGLDMIEAAALTMAVETAFRSVDSLGVARDQLFLVNGGGTMMGFAAVQKGLMRGARVVTTAGDTFAERLRALGAKVTAYGPGVVERVRQLGEGTPDLALDTAQASGALPDLVEIVGGDPKRVLAISSDIETASRLGVRHSFTESPTLRYDKLGEFAQLAADGRFSIPISRTFAFEDWREALELSQGGRAHGKLMLLPAGV